MAFFKRTPRQALLPHQYGQGVEEYGEHLLSHPSGDGFNTNRLGNILSILDVAQLDPVDFISQIEESIRGRSDAAAVGAMEQITYVHGLHLEDTPAGLCILDRALNTLHERGVPWERPKNFQRHRWSAARGVGTW